MTKAEELLWIGRVVFLSDRSSFEPLVRAHQEGLRRYLLYLTGGQQELADDLAQEAFIKSYLQLQNFQGLSRFRTWLYRIAYHLFQDHLRGKQEECSDEVLIYHADHDRQLQELPLQLDLQKALLLLKPEERHVILLHHLQGIPVAEVAQITGMPSGTVKSHLSRGRDKLAIHLKAYRL